MRSIRPARPGGSTPRITRSGSTCAIQTTARSGPVRPIDTSAASGTFSAERTAHPTYWNVGAGSDGVSLITGPADSNVVDGRNLSYVWKYRNRLYFIEKDSMNAWYLGIDSVGGLLKQIPLSGSATGGGSLIFGAVWSLDAGDGDRRQKRVRHDARRVADLYRNRPGRSGQLAARRALPDEPAARHERAYHDRRRFADRHGRRHHADQSGDHQECRPARTGHADAHDQAALAPAGSSQARLALDDQKVGRVRCHLRRRVRWRPRDRFCLVANNATGAWARFVGYDATCFIHLRDDFFFGTQDGIVMQADRTGYDDGNHMKIPYVATLVGGWETFGAPSAQVVWYQSRAVFITSAIQQFNPQLSVTTDYLITIPTPPPPSLGSAASDDLWDIGTWGPPDGGPGFCNGTAASRMPAPCAVRCGSRSGERVSRMLRSH